MDHPLAAIRISAGLFHPTEKTTVRKKESSTEQQSIDEAQTANNDGSIGSFSVSTNQDPALLKEAAHKAGEEARNTQIAAERERRDAESRARWAAQQERKAQKAANAQANQPTKKSKKAQPGSKDQTKVNQKPAKDAATLNREIATCLDGLADKTHRFLELGPKLTKSDFEGKSPQEIARLIMLTYTEQLCGILDHGQSREEYTRAIELLDRLQNEPFIPAAKGAGPPDKTKHYTGMEILNRIPHKELTAQIAILIGDLFLASELVRRITGNYDFAVKYLGNKQDNNKRNGRSIRPSDLYVCIHVPPQTMPASAKPKNEETITPVLSEAQVEIIKHAIKSIADGQFIKGVRDFVTLNPKKFQSTEEAQRELDKRVSFLADLAIVISSSQPPNKEAISLDELNKEYEAYRKFISYDDKFIQQGANEFLCYFSYSKGNNYRTRLQFVELVTYREKPTDTLEGINFGVWLCLLNTSDVEGTLDWFKNAYRVVENKGGMLALSGFASEAYLNVQILTNRKDLKLERVCAKFEKGKYESQNHRIKKVPDIFSHHGIEIDAIVSQRNGGRKLYFEHKSTGQALYKEKERAVRFVIFSNIQNMTPVFMFDKERDEIKGEERSRVIEVLDEIKERCPERQGYTQPVVFDKNAQNITNHFRKAERRKTARSVA